MTPSRRGYVFVGSLLIMAALKIGTDACLAYGNVLPWTSIKINEAGMQTEKMKWNQGASIEYLKGLETLQTSSTQIIHNETMIETFADTVNVTHRQYKIYDSNKNVANLISPERQFAETDYVKMTKVNLSEDSERQQEIKYQNVNMINTTEFRDSGKKDVTGRENENNWMEFQFDSVKYENEHRVSNATRQRSDVKSTNELRPLNGKINLNSPQKIYTIALYSFVHGMLISQWNRIDMTKCYKYKNCKVFHYKKDTNGKINADAVVIQGNHIAKKIPEHVDNNQVFVFHTIESPAYLHYTNLNQHFFKSYFNWTMTYRLDSTIPYLYGSIIPNLIRKDALFDLYETKDRFGSITAHKEYIDEVFEKPIGLADKNYRNLFRQKEKSAVWLVSHCNTSSKREQYVGELRKFIDVNIIGGCSSKIDSECPKLKTGNCEKLLVKKYKFYLAFENSLCIDYITEKVYRWFSRDIVIVVRGARRYERFLPRGTYVDANNFKSPMQLAQYLNMLGSNEEKYTNILKRMDSYSVIAPQQHVQLAFCNLCYKMNNLERYRHTIANIHDWWDRSACIAANDIYE